MPVLAPPKDYLLSVVGIVSYVLPVVGIVSYVLSVSVVGIVSLKCNAVYFCNGTTDLKRQYKCEQYQEKLIHLK